jgi:hypothetical protein
VPGSRIFYRYGVVAASAPKADSLRSRAIRYSNDGVAESAFFCNEKSSDLHSPHSGRDRWTVAAQYIGSRFLSRAGILESKHARESFSSRNTRSFCLLESRRPGRSRPPQSEQARALATRATYGRLRGVLSFSLSRTERILLGAARTTVSLSLFDRIEHKIEHTTTATQNKKTRERVRTTERAHERASGRASRRSKARHAVVGVASLANRSPISLTPQAQPTTNF